ncbi:MAG: GldG family protein [Candidatus Binatia bacterium]
MTRYLQISGISGIVLILFGLVAYFFTHNIQDPYVLVHLGLGILGLLVYIATQGGNLARSLTRRSSRFGFHSSIYTLLFIGIIIMLNFLNTRYHYRWDLTENKAYSLSSQSIKVIGQIKQELEIYGFFQRGKNPAVADLIQSYTYQSPKITFHPIDPDRHPEMAKRFKIRQFNTVHIRYGKESTNVTEITEEAITNAIVKLTKSSKKHVYFLTGHGEPKIGDQKSTAGYAAAKEALENENYSVKELLLSTREKVPKTTSLLIIAGPKKPLFDHEIKAIETYAKAGGRLLVMLPLQGNEKLSEFLKGWGIEVGKNLVVDKVIRLFTGPSLGLEPIINNYSPIHPITRDFKERTLFSMVRSVDANGTPKDGLKVTSLLKTSPTSWAETDLDGVFKRGKAAFGRKDKKGPISVGVAVTANLKKLGMKKDGGEAKIVALGTASVANNRFIRIYFNRDLFLNVINWLVGEEEFISIRPRSVRTSRIQLTEREGNIVFYLSFLIFPEILFLIGLGVWWRRR